MLMKLMKQKKIAFFLLCEYMGPTSFLYIYIYYLRSIVMDAYMNIYDVG